MPAPWRRRRRSSGHMTSFGMRRNWRACHPLSHDPRRAHCQRCRSSRPRTGSDSSTLWFAPQCSNRLTRRRANSVTRAQPVCFEQTMRRASASLHIFSGPAQEPWRAQRAFCSRRRATRSSGERRRSQPTSWVAAWVAAHTATDDCSAHRDMAELTTEFATFHRLSQGAAAWTRYCARSDLDGRLRRTAGSWPRRGSRPASMPARVSRPVRPVTARVRERPRGASVPAVSSLPLRSRAEAMAIAPVCSPEQVCCSVRETVSGCAPSPARFTRLGKATPAPREHSSHPKMSYFRRSDDSTHSSCPQASPVDRIDGARGTWIRVAALGPAPVCGPFLRSSSLVCACNSVHPDVARARSGSRRCSRIHHPARHTRRFCRVWRLAWR